MTIPDGNHVYLNDTCCKLWWNVNENIIATSRQHTHTNTCFTMFSSVGRREETKNKHLAFTTLYIQQWLKRYMCSHVKFKNVCGYNRPSQSFSTVSHICIYGERESLAPWASLWTIPIGRKTSPPPKKYGGKNAETLMKWLPPTIVNLTN